jgi:type III pantothenate kinase
MRIITIDNGNTNPHVGIFEDEKLSEVIPLANYKNQPNDFILMSNVGKQTSFKPSVDLKKYRNKNSFFNMPVLYSEKLGDDRLFEAFFVFQKIKKDERILILDAGTFLTADLVTEVGFTGGYIFPGSKTFLNSYIAGIHLPQITSLDLTEHLPHSTEEAISMAHEMYFDSILENLVKKISPSRIVLTGGDGQMLEVKYKKISSTFQLEFDPHLLHQSMFAIYLQLPKDQK